MAWEQRKSKSYFYLHRRLPDGRKMKEYFGRGGDAHRESCFLQLRKFAKWTHQWALSELKAETQEADELLNSYSKNVSDFVTAEMLAVGYHNSRSRGWRKLMKKDMNSEKTMATGTAVSVNKEPLRSKGTTLKDGKNSKPQPSPASQTKASSTANLSAAAVKSQERSRPRISPAKAKLCRDAAEGFRHMSVTLPFDNASDSEIPDTVDAECPPPAKPVEEMSPEELIAAAVEGNAQAMDRLRPMMRKDPDHFSEIGDLGAITLDKWLDAHWSKNLYARECLKMHIEEMRAQHLAEGNSPIERLLVQEIVLSWLRHNFWSSREACSLQIKPGSQSIKFGMEQTRAAQRMYLKAIAELKNFRNVKPRLP